MGGGRVLRSLVASATSPVVWIAATQLAVAEPVLLAERWPSVPAGHELSLEDHITDRLSWLGNTLGEHLDLLSHDLLQLRFDGRRRRAHVRLGGGSHDGLQIRLDGDIQLDDLNARVHARIDLGLRGRLLHLELPAFEMSPTEYRGDRGVELRLPLFVRTF
jgi:hypothetical protein